MKTVLYFDMDNVLVDFQSGLDQVSEEVKAQYADDGNGEPFYEDIPGLFALMKPMPGMVMITESRDRTMSSISDSIRSNCLSSNSICSMDWVI